MSAVDELLDRSCAWHAKQICAITDDKPCPADCTLRSVPFTREGIVKQMRFEESECQRLKRAGMFKNRLEIKDKICGIAVMGKALSKHFSDGVVEPHVIKPVVPSKGWRKGLF